MDLDLTSSANTLNLHFEDIKLLLEVIIQSKTLIHLKFLYSKQFFTGFINKLTEYKEKYF